MKKINTYQPKIEYENESVSLRKECCNYLLANNFFQNSKLENLLLIENYLIDFSIIKLFEWQQDIEKIDMEKINNLESICEIINSNIPTKEDKHSYFILYIHCIIFLLGEINKQQEIKLIEEKLDKEINIKITDNIIEKVVINKENPIHKIPSILINETKRLYEDKKVPVLKK